MRMRFLLPLSLLTLPFAAAAEILEMPDSAVPASMSSAPAVTLPAKGMLTTEVRKQFGEPTTKHAAVGGGSRQQPPITRWDYPGYSVFFENNHVVDAVIPGAPAEIRRREELVTP